MQQDTRIGAPVLAILLSLPRAWTVRRPSAWVRGATNFGTTGRAARQPPSVDAEYGSREPPLNEPHCLSESPLSSLVAHPIHCNRPIDTFDRMPSTFEPPISCSMMLKLYCRFDDVVPACSVGASTVYVELESSCDVTSIAWTMMPKTL
jgi:hypothetical protein